MSHSRVYRITDYLLQGPFVSATRLPDLQAAGATHILNVSEAESMLRPEDGPFVEIVWHPLVDFQRIPDQVALECLDTLHRMVCAGKSKVYVHCIAGWNRSPTIVWLYLIACGMEPEAATKLIVTRNWDARPGHPGLVDAQLIATVQEHGRLKYQPHPRFLAGLPQGLVR